MYRPLGMPVTQIPTFSPPKRQVGALTHSPVYVYGEQLNFQCMLKVLVSNRSPMPHLSSIQPWVEVVEHNIDRCVRITREDHRQCYMINRQSHTFFAECNFDCYKCNNSLIALKRVQHDYLYKFNHQDSYLQFTGYDIPYSKLAMCLHRVLVFCISSQSCSRGSIHNS